MVKQRNIRKFPTNNRKLIWRTLHCNVGVRSVYTASKCSLDAAVYGKCTLYVSEFSLGTHRSKFSLRSVHIQRTGQHTFITCQACTAVTTQCASQFTLSERSVSIALYTRVIFVYVHCSGHTVCTIGYATCALGTVRAL